MKIERGDIYWVPVRNETGSKREITHPHVVIQDSVINQSRINTIVVCALSTNMKRAYEPGNVLLNVGEGRLEKRSIVVVSQVSVVNKEWFGDYIGTLNHDRMSQIFAGMSLIQSLERGNKG